MHMPRDTMLMHLPHTHARMHARTCHAHAMRTPMQRVYDDAMQEQLEALAEAYADPEAETPGSDDEGDAEID